VGMELDWQRLEEVVTRAVLRARSEEMKEVAEALKLLASYMKEGFEKMFKTLEEHTNILQQHTSLLQQHSKLLEEHSKLLERHEKRLEELARAVGELKVAVGSLGRRWGRDLERTVLELYRHALEERGVELFVTTPAPLAASPRFLRLWRTRGRPRPLRGPTGL
jgi:hypothetical protein